MKRLILIFGLLSLSVLNNSCKDDDAEFSDCWQAPNKTQLKLTLLEGPEGRAADRTGQPEGLEPQRAGLTRELRMRSIGWRGPPSAVQASALVFRILRPR